MLRSPASRRGTLTPATTGLSRRVPAAAARRVCRPLRRHRLLVAVMAVATALRVVVQLAYRPALIFPDSERYLEFTEHFVTGHWYPDWIRTSGYSLLLIPAVLLHNLAVVAAAQHVLGLATAVLIYAVLIRFGARRWLAVLATVPVLFDPLELDLEQYVLTDVVATFLLVAALVVLVWRHRRVGRVAPVIAGLLIAAATIIRESDLLIMIPAVGYLAALIRPWRRMAVRSALLLAGFLPPVLGYCGWYDVWHGHFDFVSYNGEFLYGRVAQFADCTGLQLPADERPLCPRQPPAQRNPDFYMWAPQSPQWTLKVPPDKSRGGIVGDFALRIIEHQPLTYLQVVADDIVYSFSPVRGDGPEHYPIWYHQFHPYYPLYQHAIATLRAYTGHGPRVDPTLADFLTAYGRHFYVPGPLLAAGLLVGAAGMAGVGRARGSPLRAPCLLFTLGCAAVIFPPFVIATFDWRYELPQLYLIPVATVLGVTALTGRRSTRPAVAADAPPAHTPNRSDDPIAPPTTDTPPGRDDQPATDTSPSGRGDFDPRPRR